MYSLDGARSSISDCFCLNASKKTILDLIKKRGLFVFIASISSNKVLSFYCFSYKKNVELQIKYREQSVLTPDSLNVLCEIKINNI